MSALLSRIDTYLNTVPRAVCDVLEVGPFTVFLNRETDFPYLSYARPSGPLPATLGPAIAAVREVFRERGRVCRWEYLEELAPALAPALVAAGFPEPDRQPLMVVTPETFQPQSAAGAELRFLTREDDLAAVAQAQHRAFGLEGDFPDAVAGMLSLFDRGARMVAAFVAGRPVSAGVHTPAVGVTEVAGIGTDPDYQRRGFGGAVTAALVEDAFARGLDPVFLTAGDDRACRVYARVGFRVAGMGRATMDGPDPLK